MTTEILSPLHHSPRFQKVLAAISDPELQALAQDSKSEIVFADEAAGAAAVALSPREWDTSFFGRKMGKISAFIAAEKNLEHSRKLAGALFADIEQKAKAAGYRHLLKRMVGPTSFHLIPVLENRGFGLVDVGSSFILKKKDHKTATLSSRVRPMTANDLDEVRDFGTGLFRQSYFYRDSFFAKDDGDRLHREWIRNLFTGLADIIWVQEIDGKAVGFVTCKIGADKTGSIALVGVHPDHSGQGVASHVLRAAVNWFFTNGAVAITVKTQCFNYRAANLYLRNGFALDFVDMTYTKALP